MIENTRVYAELLGFGNVISANGVWVLVNFDDFGKLEVPDFDLKVIK